MDQVVRKAEVLRILRADEAALRRDHFIQSLALFGSVARDEARANSDVDLLVEFDRPVSLFDLVGAALYIEKLLDLPEDGVDLVLRRAVLPELRERIFSEAHRCLRHLYGRCDFGTCLRPSPNASARSTA